MQIYATYNFSSSRSISGVAIYRKFYTEEKEKSNGVLAISVSKPTFQPYVFMKEILNVSVGGFLLKFSAYC